MEFFAHSTITGTILPSSTIVVPTSTISVDPPGGTAHPTTVPHLPPVHTRPEFRVVHAHQVGYIALWVLSAIFAAGLVGILVLAKRVEKRARVFHWLSGAAVAISAVSYMSLAAGVGITHVPIRQDHHVLRQVLYARHIDWLLTTPLLLVSLSLLAGLSPYDTTLAVLADVVFVLSAHLASLTLWSQAARWGLYAASGVGLLYAWYIVFTSGLRAARHRESKTRGLFVLLSAGTFFVWLAYPILSAVSEGANKISVDWEIIAYGILDVTSKLGFTYFLLLVHTHGEDTWIFPEWFVQDRIGHEHDGRGAYGALGARDE